MNEKSARLFRRLERLFSSDVASAPEEKQAGIRKAADTALDTVKRALRHGTSEEVRLMKEFIVRETSR